MTTLGDLPVLVYDVGGSHVSAARCLANSWRLDAAHCVAYPSGLAADGFFQLLYSLGIQALGDSGKVGGAQLAIPAPFDYETGISGMKHKLPYL
ncbi:MAG: hypothetical protein WCC27_03350, partial [Acidobacteriaceae bacterium]